ncbi:MAG: methylmalonyl-CoA mutase family protein [Bacteroidota bacterium]
MQNSAEQKIRIVTAASLFDGHDAAINIMRRILQSKGVEVIHLGHNRSVHEIVEAAIEEDVQGIAITSYQGGHVEFFKYMKDLLVKSKCGHVKIFGGGGGTISPDEIAALHSYGITRIYSPDDGRTMGLEGMIEDVIDHCRITAGSMEINSGSKHPFWHAASTWNGVLPLGETKDIRRIAREITYAELKIGASERFFSGVDSLKIPKELKPVIDDDVTGAALNNEWKGAVIGITGTGGAGKSSVTDEIVRRFLGNFTTKTIAVISVDPSKKKTGGALLGDRIRMNSISHERAYMRSMATRDDNKALSSYVQDAINVCKNAGFDCIILESAGVGQSDASILDYCDISVYVMTPEYGAASQLEKINMLDYADLVCINKFDKAGALDALADVRKQYKRNHSFWTASDDSLPIIGSIASKFNDEGMNQLFEKLLAKIEEKKQIRFGEYSFTATATFSQAIIPPARVRYLSEITETISNYNTWVKEQAGIASKLGQLQSILEESETEGVEPLQIIKARYENQLQPDCKKLLQQWEALQLKYQADFVEYEVRGKIIRQPLTSLSLSGSKIPKVVLPGYRDWGDILTWLLQENIPGEFPYTAGVFEMKRQGEDPTRMFAGEGTPERTNKRFHYVSAGQPAKRLSTAFDSVTLYGEDPAPRPDIYGKVGNSGVSIATVDDAKKLYSGFDLCSASTSVSMTINGPAAMLLAFFMNAAIDQQCEKWIKENSREDLVKTAFDRKYPAGNLPVYLLEEFGKNGLPEGNNGLGLQLLGLSGDEVLPLDVYDQIKINALVQVRGTVQADILKEDQAQNTCIFSTEFALKLMGDVQEYFIDNKIRNFYSVSISGYHIAEAGANPITQLAFTLANGFTYVEYYLSRGMHIDDFAPNLSFFFSNGMDPEYSVIGRVARKIWAKTMKHKYKGNDRSQKLKYHIQTSGRSLHAQEIDFNDIRTTLQALYAIYDNCNSLHTNAYDEAITTPTEESVRRAMAIQLIINRELGSAKTENFIQGSFAIEALTDLVEAAVMAEFDRINERGGVLGAMERMYQRNKIQEESMHYEMQKHTGELPLVGVNTFLNKNGSPTIQPSEIIRSSNTEKDQQIQNLHAFWERNKTNSALMIERLKKSAINNENLFAELMETVKHCSLGQITHALYEVGGQYRRNM